VGVHRGAFMAEGGRGHARARDYRDMEFVCACES
jgi:hypothetical protein